MFRNALNRPLWLCFCLALKKAKRCFLLKGAWRNPLAVRSVQHFPSQTRHFDFLHFIHAHQEEIPQLNLNLLQQSFSNQSGLIKGNIGFSASSSSHVLDTWCFPFKIYTPVKENQDWRGFYSINWENPLEPLYYSISLINAG